jgi:hypothetical protein
MEYEEEIATMYEGNTVSTSTRCVGAASSSCVDTVSPLCADTVSSLCVDAVDFLFAEILRTRFFYIKTRMGDGMEWGCGGLYHLGLLAGSEEALEWDVYMDYLALCAVSQHFDNERVISRVCQV